MKNHREGNKPSKNGGFLNFSNNFNMKPVYFCYICPVD